MGNEKDEMSTKPATADFEGVGGHLDCFGKCVYVCVCVNILCHFGSEK